MTLDDLGYDDLGDDDDFKLNEAMYVVQTMTATRRARIIRIIEMAFKHRSEKFRRYDLMGWVEEKDEVRFGRDLATAREIALDCGWNLSPCGIDADTGLPLMTFEPNVSSDATMAGFQSVIARMLTFLRKAGRYAKWEIQHGAEGVDLALAKIVDHFSQSTIETFDRIGALHTESKRAAKTAAAENARLKAENDALRAQVQSDNLIIS